MLALILLSIYFINTFALFETQSIIHFICFLIIMFYLKKLPEQMNFKDLYYKYAEWIFFFVIVSKLKYYHCVYIRRFHIKLNGWYSLFEFWKKKFISVITPKMNQIPKMINYFYSLDRLTLLNDLLLQKRFFYLFFRDNVKYTTILYLV
jgi:hypothetical protein